LTTAALKYQEVAGRINDVLNEVGKVIIGKREVVTLAVTSILCNGHILIEDAPGLGKTTLAKALSIAVGCSFKRIQFTPDLLPADVTGTSIFNQKTLDFEFRKGPIFAQVILADEINRATPKTQSSLLECMEEHQVTVDGTTYPMASPFFVIATDNTLGYQGTYPLPESQLDRFMMRLEMGYPSEQEEAQIVDSQSFEHPADNVKRILSPSELLLLQNAVRQVFLEGSLRDYIVELVTATRNHPMVSLGASPRGSLALSKSARAYAALHGRDFVTPDDIRYLANPVLAHRLVLKPEARVKGIGTEKIIKEVVSNISVPV
jgi:MoxR-like ATPase